MEYTPIKNLFEVHNGLASNKLNFLSKKDNYIACVGASGRYTHSIIGYLKKESIPSDKIFPKETIYVSTNGAGCGTAFLSNFEFTLNSDCVALIPKGKMSFYDKIFYIICINKAKILFSYGRKPKGNRLMNLKLPSEVNHIYESKCNEATLIFDGGSAVSEKTELEKKNWKIYSYSELFEIKKGKRLVMNRLKKEGKTRFIASIESNNGVKFNTNVEANHTAGDRKST